MTSVVLDVVRYDRMFDAKRLGPDDSAPLLWRWTIDTATGTVHEEQLGDRAVRVPPRRRAPRRPTAPLGLRRHRAARRGRTRQRVRRRARAHRRQDGRRSPSSASAPAAPAGEWSMVPRHADAAEDDGWLVSLGYDKATDRGELVVLPAADPAAGPVARVHPAEPHPGRLPRQLGRRLTPPYHPASVCARHRHAGARRTQKRWRCYRTSTPRLSLPACRSSRAALMSARS